MSIANKTNRIVKNAGLSLGLAAGLGAGFGAVVAAADPPAALDGFERFVEQDGDFNFDPATAMRGLVHLGSYFVPKGDAAGFHHVYTQPGVPEAWRREGAFPDGTVLIKEIATHRTADYTTGQGVASATEARQWFVMIKDGGNRFPDHPLWGQGWGWALYKSDAPTTNVARDYRLDCLGCHAPARPNDWVYVEGYPALRALRAAGEKTGPRSEIGK
ncbi:MAG: cytochrome P460 family protein [Myxococcota bacterium]